jgi:hypothetical protein
MMKRKVWTAIRLLFAAVIVVYLVDWAILRIRVMRGTGFGTVQVDEYLSTPLKGNKAEYDYLGTTTVTCSHSIFPHGAAPCWWRNRHRSVWE